MTIDEEVLLLRQENEELKKQLKAALALIAELEKRRDPPSFVKANRPKPTEPKATRKKRAQEHNHGRLKMEPTRIERHALDRCPDCNYQLQGESVDYKREVIEIPEPQPVEVIEHQVIKRWCPKCESWRTPKLDLADQVLDQGRIGLQTSSLVAYLRISLRLTIRQIVIYLKTLHNLRLSIGQVVEILHRLSAKFTPLVANLKAQARASPILHADETGWRENGLNGYIWAFSTPGEEAVRYYEYDRSRGQGVVKRILDDEFKGHLVTDFYAGYNIYSGAHQRCWVHLLRDLHALKEEHSSNDEVVAWAQAVRDLYDEGQRWLSENKELNTQEREAQYVSLLTRMRELALVHAKAYEHACNTLAKRLLRHEDEMFQFVLIPGLSADNNLAERSVRPLVVIRKISGGSRSEKGSKTRMTLSSLFATWQVRGINPFSECLKILIQTHAPQTSAPQISAPLF